RLQVAADLFKKQPSGDDTFEIRGALRGFKRQIKPVLLCMVLCIGASAAYLYVAPKKYTAKATILIEPNSYGAIAKDQA
ncbi:hypothetical protein J8J27_34905, partial [Mycobacterium tuberculosis]|nr:hypothetical protein [Mycobacterium tuberculosis]